VPVPGSFRDNVAGETSFDLDAKLFSQIEYSDRAHVFLPGYGPFQRDFRYNNNLIFFISI
jgi:hypothetical protein